MAKPSVQGVVILTIAITGYIFLCNMWSYKWEDKRIDEKASYMKFEPSRSGRVHKAISNSIHNKTFLYLRQNSTLNSQETDSLLPECDNLLTNLTRGKWVALPNLNSSELDAAYAYYWRKRQILKARWRDDGKCGFYNLLDKVVGSKQPARSGWCDRDGHKPCCSDKLDGTCEEASQATCECDSCVDMRKYMHAELSEWRPRDPRCQMRLYNPSEACQVIERSIYNDIRFIGDSLVRNMFAAFVTLLSGDTERGAWGKRMTEEQKEKCVGVEFYFWDFCRSIVRDLNDSIHAEKFCGGRIPRFSASASMHYSLAERFQFREEVKNLIGKQGSLVLVGVGLHMQLHSEQVIESYLHPAVQLRENFYTDTNTSQQDKWPHFMFVLPLLHGLLKPLDYYKLENEDIAAVFAREMKVYLDKYQIPLLDFRTLGNLVHSFDGTHYGLGVNLVKNQILLNFIAQLQKYA